MRTIFALVGVCLLAAASTVGEVLGPTAEPIANPGVTTGTTLLTAPRQDVVDRVHGVDVPDPYRWLEDAAAVQTRAWVDAQDAVARATLAARPEREELARRLRDLFYLESTSAPVVRGGRHFYTRRHKDREKAIVYWRQGEDGAERLLLDPHAMSPDGTASLGGWWPSPDGRWVVYARRENNADEATLHVREVATGQDSTLDVLPGAKYAEPSWTPDAKGFYYEWLPPPDAVPVAERPGYTELRFHALGTAPSGDTLVFPATGDPRMFLGGALSRDGRYLFVHLQHGWNSNDVYFKSIPAARQGRDLPFAPEGGPAARGELSASAWIARCAAERGFRPLVVGEDATFQVEAWRGSFYVLSNAGATRYRMFKVDPRTPERDRWREIVPEGEAKIETMRIVGNRLALTYLRHAASEMELRDLGGRLVRRIELPGIGSTGAMVGSPDEDEAYYDFSSFTRPKEIYRTSIRSGKTALWARIDLPIDTSQVEVAQLRYASKDGTPVSMFLIHRKGLRLDGSHPTLLYGYGGFNQSMTPSFSGTIVTWVERGGIYAVANLRGGGEYGEAWHRAGMLERKQNVFDDFIAAAEYLIGAGYTSSDRLAIYGGSNGGLLVGAAMTQRPELFRAVVCAVPLLDMVRYHLFGSGKTWIPEYGSAEDPSQFQVLHAYSPYHRVVPGTRYPALLMLAADSDDRVDPLHARKFTAAIQWATASEDRPVLLRVERNAGHGGADLVHRTVERHADQLAFLLWQLGG